MRNEGEQSLTISSLNVPDGFSISLATPVVIQPNSLEFLTICLNSGATGNFEGSISIVNSDGPNSPDGLDENTFNIAVTATVIPRAPEVTVIGNGVEINDEQGTPSGSDGTDYGNVVVGGATISRSFTVRNDGDATLTLASLSVPAGFTITNGLSGSLAPGASDMFTVRFDTSVAGTKSADIVFSTNDSNESTFNFRMTGTVTITGAHRVQQPRLESINRLVGGNVEVNGDTDWFKFNA